jgi:hypothetical protein
MSARFTPEDQPPFRRSTSRPPGASPGPLGREVDRDTMARMVRGAANAKLAEADGLLEGIKEMCRIADIAEAIGAHETADALTRTLEGIGMAARRRAA